MERIGYIYRYNEEEEKGILVYGCNTDVNRITYKPIKFCKTDCLSDVCTGQLVYFRLENTSFATQIERASLSNFKRALFSELVSCYETERDWNFSFLHQLIRYEDLNDIGCNFWDDFDLFLDEQEGEQSKEYQPKKCPDSIDELFALFGTMDHHTGLWNSTAGLVTIDIVNIEYWLDEDVAKSNSFYGKTANEVLDLFDLFVRKRRNAHLKYNPSGVIDDSISPRWKLLLASLKWSDLIEICKKEPMLQPALPIDFCNNNLDVLSIDFGFPDVSVCEAYYRYRIGIVNRTAEYSFMSERIYTASHCTAKHKENEGVQACKMGKKVLKELKDLLEKQYRAVVLYDVKQKLTSLSDNKINGKQKVSSLLKEKNTSYLMRIGQFIDVYVYNCVICRKDCSEIVVYDDDYYSIINMAIALYKGLTEEDQRCLNVSIRNKFKECAIGIAQSQTIVNKAYKLCSLINDHSVFLSPEDFETIKRIVHEEFVRLDDLDDLNAAANCGFISEKEHLKRYKEIIRDSEIEGLLGVIEYDFHKKTPILAQSHVIREIINKFDFKTLNAYNYKRTGHNINNLEDLIDWLNRQSRYGNVDSNVWEEILKETTDKLSKEDRWRLFEKDLIVSPCLDNIREHLDNAYSQNLFKDSFFRKDCFQDVMCSDILTIDDINQKIMIANHLEPKYQRELLGKCEGAMKLYLWAINPDDSFDWDLVTLFFAELPEEQQIRLFRNIFFQIASKSVVITIDELYKTLVESEKKACQAVRGLMYLLKELLTPDGVLKNEVLDEIIGDGIGNIRKFLKAKTFFYPCNGHIALTQNKQDRDYHTYNGCINKVVIRGIAYYSISFYDIPHDVCDGEVDWLDNTDILKAKAVLETNLKAKLINGDYIISISEEVAVKQFVMAFHIDDHCCLLDTKQLMIEKGYLPPNNSYQPLYTNYIRPYDDDSFDVCRCTDYIDVDPINGIPFYWCDKKPCVRRCHYILPLSEWEEFKVSDFIYILLGSKRGNLHKVWKMTIKMSLFINAYVESKRHKVESDEHNGKGQSNTEKISIKKSEEIGVLTDELSVVQDICDFDDGYEEYEEYDDSGYDEYSQDDDTYGRYAGSYAQDEMGYSDDDIDTIFDGDPSAYWNID